MTIYDAETNTVKVIGVPEKGSEDYEKYLAVYRNKIKTGEMTKEQVAEALGVDVKFVDNDILNQ